MTKLPSYNNYKNKDYDFIFVIMNEVTQIIYYTQVKIIIKTFGLKH